LHFLEFETAGKAMARTGTASRRFKFQKALRKKPAALAHDPHRCANEAW
jgi:hypothetical protein